MSEYEVVRVNGKLTIKRKAQEEEPKKGRKRTRTPEEIAAYMKQYREEHEEQIKANRKRWYQLHREEKQAKSRAYYHDNIEKCRAYQKAYYRKKKMGAIKNDSK